MNWLLLACLSVGCVLAAYPALRAPAPGVMVAAVAAASLLVAGGITRRHRLLVWSADTVVLEYCLGLILADRRPGVLEPVVLGLGIVAFLELSDLSLLSPTPFRTAEGTGEGSTGEMPKRGWCRHLGYDIAVRMAATAGISVALAIGLHYTARVASLPATLTFPMLVAGASLAALCIYLLVAMSLSARAGFGHSAGDKSDIPD